jgi:predicted nucleic acid-binding protein
MAFGVVLDTCVLYPFSLCDLLLRLADRELYDPFWSDRILDELARNLAEAGLTAEQVAWRISQMRQAFPAAEVPADAVARLEPAMANHPKDRHVLAAAVASGADAIVTSSSAGPPCGPVGGSPGSVVVSSAVVHTHRSAHDQITSRAFCSLGSDGRRGVVLCIGRPPDGVDAIARPWTCVVED